MSSSSDNLASFKPNNHKSLSKTPEPITLRPPSFLGSDMDGDEEMKDEGQTNKVNAPQPFGKCSEFKLDSFKLPTFGLAHIVPPPATSYLRPQPERI